MGATAVARTRPALGVALLGVLLLLARKPGALIDPSIWAEDGRIFLAQALQPGSDLLVTYAAQVWVVPRVVFLAVTQLPLTWLPIVLYVVSCIAVVAALSPVLQSRAAALFGTFGWQVTAFVLLLLLPTATEIQGNVANLHIWMAIGLLVLLALPDPVSGWGRWLELGYVALAVLNGFLGVFLTPVAAWMALMHRTRQAWLRLGVVGAGAAVNLTILVLDGRTAGTDVLDRVATVPGAIAKRWGGGMTLGNYLMRFVWPDGFLSVFLVPALLVLALLVYLAWRDRNGPSPAWLVAGGLWLVLGVVAPAGGIPIDWVQSATGGWRYVAVAIAAGLLVIVRSVPVTGGVVWAAVGLTACSAAIISGAFLRGPQPPVGSEQLRAFEQCLQSPQRPCVLPIAPQGWTVEVP